jgi:hypothetical protein
MGSALKTAIMLPHLTVTGPASVVLTHVLFLHMNLKYSRQLRAQSPAEPEV